MRRPRRGWWVPVVVAFATMLGLNLLGGPQTAADTATFLFQAVVPGLDEELLFRGLPLVWIRIRWASLVPAVLAHDAINTAAAIADAL